MKEVKAPFLFDGTRNCSTRIAGESGLISQRGGRLMAFLTLQLEPGVYSPVMEQMDVQNSCFFSNVRTPV